MKFIGFTLILAIYLLFENSLAFIAYECGGVDSNYTSISLVDVGKCDIKEDALEEEEVMIQLLQPRSSHEVWARACKVEVNYIVYYCGMHSHNSIVKGGIVSKVLAIGKSQCVDMHRERSVVFYGTRLSGLVMNDTISVPVNFAGHTGPNGACQSAEFVDGNQNWGDVTATGTIKVSLYEFTASVRIDKREVRLPSGSLCQLDAERCIDNDHGPTFWDAFTSTDCQKDSFHVLYRGLATRTRRVRRHEEEAVVSVYAAKTKENIFTLSSERTQPFCFIHLGITEHPKLFVHEVRDDNYFFTQEKANALDLDMFMYVNAKFVHLEHSISTQMTRMYAEVVHHRCEMDRRILDTKLSLAAIAPMEFAYEHMRGPGYTASILGESVNIVACAPVDVVAAHTDECTLEMPVSYKNQTFYMRPRSRILQRSGTPIPCDGVLQPKYRINGQWFATTPSLHVTNPPQVLQPDSSNNWTYISAGALAIAGIYTPSQIERLREQIMSPIERHTKGERFAGLLNSEHFNTGGLDLSMMHNDAILQSKIKAFWEGTWGYATSFGTLSAGLLGLAFIFKLVKFLFDTFIHALTLREVYGCTWHILGSVWDAMTTYLLTRITKNKTDMASGAERGLGNLYVPTCVASAPSPNHTVIYESPDKGSDSHAASHMYPNLKSNQVSHVRETAMGGATEVTIPGVDIK